jgi:hypothetical protein
MTRNKLYSLLLIACLAGFIYLFYTFQKSENDMFRVCIIKNATGFPCTSCGTTRAMQLLFQGDFTESLKMNPFGIIVAILMTMAPIWIAIDLVFKKDTFFHSYKRTEVIIRTKWLAVFLIILVLLNWIWNINKHL